MNNTIYIQPKNKVIIPFNKLILLGDLLEIYASDDNLTKNIGNIEFKVEDKDRKGTFVISILSIIPLINIKYPGAPINIIGDTDILLQFQELSHHHVNKIKSLKAILVCFLLFIGAATAIINFHSDVDMVQSQKTIYRIITGRKEGNLLVLQIPYSIGIGVGMSVFFNHIFKKRINNEPSPLEIEIYMYQENLDQYTKKTRNKNNKEPK